MNITRNFYPYYYAEAYAASTHFVVSIHAGNNEIYDERRSKKLFLTLAYNYFYPMKYDFTAVTYLCD